MSEEAHERENEECQAPREDERERERVPDEGPRGLAIRSGVRAGGITLTGAD